MMDNESLRFIIPSAAYLEEIRAYRQEFLDEGGSMDGAGPLRRFDDPAEWLQWTERCQNPETVPEDIVQATQFICVRESDDTLVGMLQVRHAFNDYLEKYAGHIGYSVRPSERKKGYATWMLRQGLDFCRTIGLTRVLVCCKVENEASRRTILANGGVFENSVYEPERKRELQRYWIDLSVPSLK
jgi:predicted acetyltransferase